jgi:hypothetical protein
MFSDRSPKWFARLPQRASVCRLWTVREHAQEIGKCDLDEFQPPGDPQKRISSSEAESSIQEEEKRCGRGVTVSELEKLRQRKILDRQVILQQVESFASLKLARRLLLWLGESLGQNLAGNDTELSR